MYNMPDEIENTVSAARERKSRSSRGALLIEFQPRNRRTAK
jgi:hypothetical protein